MSNQKTMWSIETKITHNTDQSKMNTIQNFDLNTDWNCLTKIVLFKARLGTVEEANE